jgi:hypothetical protein
MAGRGNFSGREKKKVKKGNQKLGPVNLNQAPVEVERIQKKKKNFEEE